MLTCDDPEQTSCLRYQTLLPTWTRTWSRSVEESVDEALDLDQVQSLIHSLFQCGCVLHNNMGPALSQNQSAPQKVLVNTSWCLNTVDQRFQKLTHL